MSPLIKNFSQTHFPWLEQNSFNSEIVIASRARIARNVEGYNFPEKADNDMRSELVDVVFEAVEKLPMRKKVYKSEIENLEEKEKKILLERRLLTFETLFDFECGIILEEKEKFSILVNEEDHLHIQALRPGLQLKKCWKESEKLEEQLSKFLKFSFNNDFGYLTSCPANVGTGLKMSVYLDLTGASLLGQLSGVLQSAKVLGHKICGENGEEGDYKGMRFLLSSHRTIGISETDVLKEFNEYVKDIVNVELMARRKLLADYPQRILNHVSRAFGLLKSSWILSEDEAYDNLMILRTGVLMGAFEKVTIETVNTLVLFAGDAHLQSTMGGSLMPEELDMARAEIFKEKLTFK
jgi:protein arginine kinase